MPSPLVVEIRARLKAAERPLTAVERALLIATVAGPSEGAEDLVRDVRQAAVTARTQLRHLPPAERAAMLTLVEAVEHLMEHSAGDARTQATTAAVMAGNRGAHAHAAAAPHWTDRDREVELTGAPR